MLKSLWYSLEKTLENILKLVKPSGLTKTKVVIPEKLVKSNNI